MEVRTINDKVLVRVSPPTDKVGSAGIVVPRESRDDHYIGQVAACAPTFPVDVGEHVVFQQLPKGMPYDTVIVGKEELLAVVEG